MSETAEALPVMTREHEAAATAPAAIIESGAFGKERKEIHTVIRALSSGTRRVVSVEQLKVWAKSLLDARYATSKTEAYRGFEAVEKSIESVVAGGGEGR